MDFSTGNSGNKLFETVTKIGPGCQLEGAYCQYLGPKIAPYVYSVFDEGYTMERLQIAPRRKNLLMHIESALSRYVWSRQPVPSTNDRVDWREELKKFAIEEPPDYVVNSRTFGLVHGDPTVSNALERNGRLIMCDPRPPRAYMPQLIETDMGRILQSYLGWEVVAYGARPVDFDLPLFFYTPDLFRKVLFWTAAAAARIKHLEYSRENQRSHVIRWCNLVIDMERDSRNHSSRWRESAVQEIRLFHTEARD